MEDKLNAELLQLQDELMTLEKAVTHISRAEELSTNMVESTKLIHQKFSDHLDVILNQYKDYLDKSFTHTENQVYDLASSHQKQIDDVRELLSEYKLFVHETKIQYEGFLNKTYNHIEEKITTLSDVHQDLIGQVQTLLDEYRGFIDKSDKRSGKHLETSMAKYDEYLSKSYSDAETKITDLTTAAREQTGEVKNLITEYVDVVLLTAQLSDKIAEVDFPERLDKIDTTISTISQEFTNTTKQVEFLETELRSDIKNSTYELNESIEKQNKQMEMMKILIFVLIGICVAMGIGTFWF